MAVMVLFASKRTSISLSVKDRLGTLGMLGMLGGVPTQMNSAFAGRITGIQAKPKDARSPLSARPVRLARRRYWERLGMPSRVPAGRSPTLVAVSRTDQQRPG